ncbi:unnamed protein product [Rhizophagus irregularis]|uniref:Uncharacterized protein n=1 Tax=Rhizophagus irregularis TaxID=588596 RepID=A0A2I1GQN7_9GLOM|nr:hypothetical protein RhiirA4_544914 [Rhizophagus irregularis]CAB4433880.1 unnamed protein product [Rhizophagus irregularis]CAB4434029.1 unnamed protein product [Rhizophagus irregularis]
MKFTRVLTIHVMMIFIVANFITSAYGIFCNPFSGCSLCSRWDCTSYPDLKEYRCRPGSCKCKYGGESGKCSQCAPPDDPQKVGTWYHFEECDCASCIPR